MQVLEVETVFPSKTCNGWLSQHVQQTPLNMFKDRSWGYWNVSKNGSCSPQSSAPLPSSSSFLFIAASPQRTEEKAQSWELFAQFWSYNQKRKRKNFQSVWNQTVRESLIDFQRVGVFIVDDLIKTSLIPFQRNVLSRFGSDEGT